MTQPRTAPRTPNVHRHVVVLEHRRLDRHGPGWQSVTDGVDGDAGWPLYLDRYTQLLRVETRP